MLLGPDVQQPVIVALALPQVSVSRKVVSNVHLAPDPEQAKLNLSGDKVGGNDLQDMIYAKGRAAPFGVAPREAFETTAMIIRLPWFRGSSHSRIIEVFRLFIS